MPIIEDIIYFFRNTFYIFDTEILFPEYGVNLGCIV